MLLALLAVCCAGLFYFLVGRLDAAAAQRRRDDAAAHALAQAREALIGDAIAQASVAAAGTLRLPDLGFGIGGVPSEGESAPNFTGNDKDRSVIGKVPWKTLKLGPLRDGAGECLWYAVSGRFKKTPLTDTLNWDTPGQIDIIDANAGVVARNVAALIVAPGAALDGQRHVLADAGFKHCGGNHDARNYLDAFDAADAPGGEVNYFTGSPNGRVAIDSGNKRFVLASAAHHNDRFLFITPDDLFAAISRRSDFAGQIAALLDDADLRRQAETGHAETVSVSAAGSKGADHIDCDSIAAPTTRAFCRNWREMLLLTELPTSAAIAVGGAAQPGCRRVLIFGGQRTAGQVRVTAGDKANAANYVEGENLAAFRTPVAASAQFSGALAFDPGNASADIVRCLP